MKLEFSKHAKQRMIERGIKLEQIKETMELPDYTIRKGSKVEAYKNLSNKTLKVIYSQEDSFINVITVIWK